MDRRRSDQGTSAQVPVMQVVGFHVEGMSPSPVPNSILGDRKQVAGSPTPVIIPPTFQQNPTQQNRDGSGRPGDAGGVSKGLSSMAAGQPQPLPPGMPGLAGPAAVRTSSAADTAGASSGSHKSAPVTPSKGVTQQGAQRPQSAGSTPRAGAAAAGRPEPIQEAADDVDSDGSAVSTSTAGAAAGPAAPAAAAAGAAAAAAAADGKAGPPPKGPPADKDEKPKLTRAERRAIQDAQRAAKAASKDQPEGSKSKASSTAGDSRPKTPSGPASGPASAAATQPGTQRGAVPERTGSKSIKKDKGVSLNSTELFAHLQQYNDVSVQSIAERSSQANVHPAIVQLGLRYADGSIVGGNARCVALLHALAQVVHDYSTPEGKSLSRDLTAHLNTMIAFLVECRPLSVSMGNAIKHLKLFISKIDPSTAEEAAKQALVREIHDYVEQKVVYADKGLVEHAVAKVYDGDVVLTYAMSSVVLEVLLQAHARGKRFRVVVMDSRPELEGRQLLSRLVQAGISCSYILINGLSYIMSEVTKVFLGAAAVLANGTVISRAGCAAVAMMAAAHSTPVLICCETYKFHERVQLDAITNNELGDPRALLSVPGRKANKALQDASEQLPHLGLLNLKYDAMPADYVTMVVTEFGMIPPTSVPVILREYRQES